MVLEEEAEAGGGRKKNNCVINYHAQNMPLAIKPCSVCTPYQNVHLSKINYRRQVQRRLCIAYMHSHCTPLLHVSLSLCVEIERAGLGIRSSVSESESDSELLSLVLSLSAAVAREGGGRGGGERGGEGWGREVGLRMCRKFDYVGLMVESIIRWGQKEAK